MRKRNLIIFIAVRQGSNWKKNRIGIKKEFKTKKQKRIRLIGAGAINVCQQKKKKKKNVIFITFQKK